MGLCSSTQKRLAVTPEQHRLKELKQYSDTQARAITKKNAQIAAQRAEIHEKDKDLIQARKSTAERLEAQHKIYQAREQRHLKALEEIIDVVSEAAESFTPKLAVSARDTPSLCCRQEAALPLSPLRLP